MPIEVRELIIRATIQEPSEGNQRSRGTDERERDGIIAEAVEQVMELLEQQKER